MQLLVLCSALSLLLGLLYLPVLWELGHVWWTDPNYSHGFLIPLIAGCLVWNQRETWVRAAGKPSTWGALLVCLGLLLYLIGGTIAIAAIGRGGLFVKGLSLIPVLYGLVLLCLGKESLKTLALPLAYLVFMVPLPKNIFAMVTLPLQLYASNVATTAIQLLDIPALREGNLIHLPAVTLGITDACSGIRSLFTLLAGTIVLSYVAQKRWWHRLILIVSAVPIAIITNATRVTGTGLLAHFWGPAVAEGFFHGFSGWVILILAALLLGAEVLLLARLPAPEEPEDTA